MRSKQKLIQQLVDQQATTFSKTVFPLFPDCQKADRRDGLTLFIQKTFIIQMTPLLIRAVNHVLSGKHYLSVDPNWLEQQAQKASEQIMCSLWPVIIPKLLLFLFTDVVRQHCLAQLYPNAEKEYSVCYIRSYLTAYYLHLEKHLYAQLKKITCEEGADPLRQLVYMTQSTAEQFQQYLEAIKVKEHILPYFATHFVLY